MSLKIIPAIVTHNDSLFENENYVVRRDHYIYEDGLHIFTYEFYISRKEIITPVKNPKEGEPKHTVRLVDKRCPHFLYKNEFGVYCVADKTIPKTLEYIGPEHKYFQRYYQEMKTMDIDAHPEIPADKIVFRDKYIIWKFDDEK